MGRGERFLTLVCVQVLELHNERGLCHAQQSGFYTEKDGKMTALDLVCSGIIPIEKKGVN